MKLENLHKLVLRNALGNMQSSQEHLKTIVYAKLFWGRGCKQSVLWGIREWIHYLKKLCNASWRIDL